MVAFIFELNFREQDETFLKFYLEVDDDGEDEDGGHEVHQIGQILAIEDVGAWRAFRRADELSSGRVLAGFMGLVKVRLTVLITVMGGVLLLMSAVATIPTLIVGIIYGAGDNTCTVYYFRNQAVTGIASSLAATIGEEAITLEDVYEPYLMQIGFLSRTPRGRCVTLQAYRHLNLEPADGQQML